MSCEPELRWTVPDNWAWTSLSKIGEIVAGGTPSTKEPTYWSNEINWISPADLTGYSAKTIKNGAKSISRVGLANSSAKVMPAGSVHFSSRAPIGYVVISSEQLATNQGFKSLVPAPGISNEFVYYYLIASREYARKRASGTTFLELSGRAFGSLPIPLAPTVMQHRIVTKIEELFSELDEGIESLKIARAQLATYRQAVLKHAFEGKLTAQWREENKDKLEKPEQLLARIKKERAEHYERQFNEWKTSSARWHRECQQGQKPKKPLKPKPLPPLATKTLTGLPPLPSGWLWARIGEIGLVGTGATPLKSKSEYYVNGDVPWVTSGALNDPFVSRSTHYVTKAALNDTNLRVYPPNTLVVALYGEGKTRGKCSELLIEATTNQAIAAIVQEGIAEGLRGMLKWFLMKNYEEVRIGSSGGVQPNLNLGIIENSLVPICSIDEATKIEKNIKQKFSQADELEKELVTRLQQSDVLRQAILKKAFSGQLVPQDSNDETASVLLDRIKAERKQKSKSKIVTRRTTKKRTIA